MPDPKLGRRRYGFKPAGSVTPICTIARARINDDFPFLWATKAAGVVEAVGAGVTSIAPGDFVVLNWRAVCGYVPGLSSRDVPDMLFHPQCVAAR